MRVLLTAILVAFALVGFVGPPSATADCVTTNGSTTASAQEVTVTGDISQAVIVGASRAGPTIAVPIAISNLDKMDKYFRPAAATGSMKPGYDRYKMEGVMAVVGPATAPPLRE